MRWEITVGGLGGQGAITAGHIIGQAAVLYDKKEAVMTEHYSPYITGGWSRADVVVSDEAVDYPLVSKPDVLIAMSQEIFDTYAQNVKKQGIILTEKSLVKPSESVGAKLFRVPGIATAERLGKRVVANIVLLGAFTGCTGVITEEAMIQSISRRFRSAEQLNRLAFQEGVNMGKEI